MNVESYGWKDIQMPYYWDRKLSDFLVNATKGDKVLDVGCGNGYLVSVLLKNGFDAYGVDQAKDGIALAKREIDPKRFYLCDINEDDLPEEINFEYDTITSTETIEHLFSPDSYLKFCNSKLKMGGGEIGGVYTLPWIP